MIIETERLYLRQWKESDKVAFAQLNSDPEVMRYFPKTFSASESDASVERYKKFIEDNQFGMFAAELKETGEFIGFIGLNKPTFNAPFTPCVEVGWRLNKSHWGKGYAPEGARACLDFAFKQFELDEVVAFAPILNGPSQRVMEKIGMKRDFQGDFYHPMIDPGHNLQLCVLYRAKKSQVDN